MTSVSEVVETLSLIPGNIWPRFREREPEWLPVPERWSDGMFLNLLVVCALNDYQPKGRAEVAYWPPIRRLILSSPAPRSNVDLIEMLRPFYAQERFRTAKLDRLERYLTSDLARETAQLSAQETAPRLVDFHQSLARAMGQARSDKTIALAMKCLVLGLRILGVPDPPVHELAVPVDSRVRALTQRIGLLGVDPSDEEVRACWAAILRGLQRVVPDLTMVELDSLLWQGARFRSPSEVAQWLADEYGISTDTAERIGRLFHGSPGTAKTPESSCTVIPRSGGSRQPQAGPGDKPKPGARRQLADVKVTELRYPSRSHFLPECARVVMERRDELLAGKVITVRLSPQGYNRQTVALIERDSPRSFWIDKKSDPTRFSARIRAAAYALFRQGYFGCFEIIHDTGMLTIRAISFTPPVPSAHADADD